MDWTNFHFLRPYWLLLLPLTALLWHLHRKSQDPLLGWRKIMAPELLEALVQDQGRRRDTKSLLLLIAWTGGIISVAGPTWRLQPNPFSDAPVPVMLLVKADSSMNLPDLAPSRMERARLKAVDFAAARPGLPLGLIAYAGSAHLVLPPTKDTKIVGSMAQEISPEIMPKDGDDLDAAIRLAAEAVNGSNGSIIIITDTMPLGKNEIPDVPQSIHVLAIAPQSSPDLEQLISQSRAAGASAVPLSADSRDIETLLKQVASAPIRIDSELSGQRWQEAGWWLTPILALLSLLPFQRLGQTPTLTEPQS